MFIFRHKHTGWYVDAYEKRFFQNRPGFEVVLRPKQRDYSQKWILHREPNNLYSITHAETGRFLDAFESNPQPGSWTWDRTVVTRLSQESGDNWSQRWIITAVPGSVEGSHEYYIRQASSKNFLDSWEDKAHDYQVCARENQSAADGSHHPSQIWILERQEDLPDLDGVYIFRQKDTGRLLDAHQNPSGNLEVITRDVEFSQSQHFIIRRVLGYAYTVMQESTGKFLDAYETGSSNWRYNFTAVMRPYQPDDSQKWFIEKLAYNEFRFMHHVTGRMLTAFEDAAHDYVVKTHDRDELDDEKWVATKIGEIPQLEGIWTIQQKSSGKYLDAYPTIGVYQDPGQEGLGFEAVVRDKQYNMSFVSPSPASLPPSPGPLSMPEDTPQDNSQHWILVKRDGEVYEMKQESSGKLLDALEEPDTARWWRNYAACIRPNQRNPSQLWYFQWIGENEYTIRQHGNTRYLDAWPDASHDFLAVTRPLQPNDDSQIWIMKRVGDLCTPLASCADFPFQCGSVDDGCDGQVFCGPHPQGQCAQRNVWTNMPYACEDHACVCTPKPACDVNNTCGWQDDGCGGVVYCGEQANGTAGPLCKTKNPISGQRDKCMFNATKYTQSAAGVLPFAPEPNNHTCVCQPRLICSNTSECGVEEDGCGGFVTCNQSPMANMEGNCSAPQHECVVHSPGNHSCTCIPKTVCDTGNVCGFQDDGCGGTVACGNNGTCTNGTNFACNASTHQCTCQPKPCGEWLCGLVPDDGCGKQVNCGGCQVADKECDTKKHVCIPRPPPPCPNPPCGGPTAPGPAPVSPAPWALPAPAPAPAPGPSPGPGGPAPLGAPGPSPAPGPEVMPFEIPKDLTPAYAAANEEVARQATGMTANQQAAIAGTKLTQVPESNSTAQMPDVQKWLQSKNGRVKWPASLLSVHNLAAQPPLSPIPHGGNIALRNALPNAEAMIAQESVLAVNDTLWTEKPFWAGLAALQAEQNELRVNAKEKIDAVVKNLVWDVSRRAQQATRDVLSNMPPPYLNAGMTRLHRTLYDRIVRHIPGIGPSPAPAPAPMSTPGAAPVSAIDSDEGDADSKEINSQMKKVSDETLKIALAEIDKTKYWMKKVADQYTIAATIDGVKSAWPASQAIGQNLETQVLSGSGAAKAQAAFLEAINDMQSNAMTAAKEPADEAAFSVAPEAVTVATKTATDHLALTIARQSILNAKHVLGGISSGVVVDQLDGKVQEMGGKPLADKIDHKFHIVDKTVPAEFDKIAAQTVNSIMAQMNLAQGPSAAGGPGAAPMSAPPR